MTFRSLQSQLKSAGHPWTIGKVFPDAAIIGPWINADNLDFLNQEFTFTLDGAKKQQTTGTTMIYSPIELIVQASQHFPLCAGDILFTGTPSGVGAVKPNSIGELRIGTHGYSVEWIEK